MMAKTKPSWPEVTGPLAEYADGFRAELARLGYTPLTAAGQLRLMAHLSRWMTAEGLDARVLEMPAVERYFEARRSAGYVNERTVEALGPLLGYLHGLGAAPLPSAAPATETGRLLDRFAGYLAAERGLAPRTVALDVRLARPFLQQRAQERDGRLDLGQLTAVEVRSFALDQARKQPRSVKRIVTALRSLLRFLHVDGAISVPLAGAVPSPARHTLAGLPQALEPGQVEAMLASCDPATATGRRDRAVLLLLSRMGLRAGEAAALGLDDIDWRRGEITVRGKGGRRDRLPLPADVGAAIVAYLRDGRPASALDRTVFISAQAPRQALTYLGITTIVADAARRAGIPGRVHAHSAEGGPGKRTRRNPGTAPRPDPYIIGKNGNSAIGTLVERTTRYVMLVHLPIDRSAERMRDALVEIMATLPAHLKRSLTWGQGSEMGRHHEFAVAADMPVYFCNPASPWQRGSNENTNGLLRQYFPKGTDLSVHTREYLDAVAAELNARP